jgi:hypothetical protein
MKVQIIPNFIIEHHIKVNEEVDINLVSPIPWSCILMVLFAVTNNQTKYEALMFGLGFLVNARFSSIKAFRDSKLVV